MSNTVQARLQAISTELNAEFMERTSAVEGNLLALCSKQHSFNLGLPGTAKSQLINAIIDRFTGVTYFEALLSKTRPDAAILGPYNLPQLREHGDFRRKTAGFLPTVDLAFLDEIGKMSPTLGHDLLAILNERKYHEVNGERSTQIVPLSTAFTASNELICDESDDAAALWDRLLIRIYVEPIQEIRNIQALLKGAALQRVEDATPHTTIEWSEMRDAINNDVPAVIVPDNIIQVMIDVRRALHEVEIRPSDRRIRQAVRVVQASAYLNGRSEATEDDIAALRFVLWDSPEHRVSVERLTMSISNPIAEKVMSVIDTAKQIAGNVASRKGEALESRAAYAAEAASKIKQLLGELGKAKQDAIAAGRNTKSITDAEEYVIGVRNTVYSDGLDLDTSPLR